MRIFTGIENTGIFSGVVARGLLTVIMLSAAGCGAAPPVQEMSDARQAIAAAKEAGAEQSAPAEFHAAEAFLDSAQRKLSERLYAQARRDALQAKASAHDALALIEDFDSDPP